MDTVDHAAVAIIIGNNHSKSLLINGVADWIYCGWLSNVGTHSNEPPHQNILITSNRIWDVILLPGAYYSYSKFRTNGEQMIRPFIIGKTAKLHNTTSKSQDDRICVISYRIRVHSFCVHTAHITRVCDSITNENRKIEIRAAGGIILDAPLIAAKIERHTIPLYTHNNIVSIIMRCWTYG